MVKAEVEGAVGFLVSPFVSLVASGGGIGVRLFCPLVGVLAGFRHAGGGECFLGVLWCVVGGGFVFSG
ncbi:hypothetical protein, partial [Bifidobacterium animalis]|uniref:hypothetical protein n=1 Tax=Bifidobacterium animalis TaxID=28025 RepID=UPI001EE3A36E